MTVFEEFIQQLQQYDSLEAIQSRFQDRSGIIKELGSITVLCSKKIIDPDPDNFILYDPDDATVVGLFVKLHKGLKVLLSAHFLALSMLYGRSYASTMKRISR